MASTSSIVPSLQEASWLVITHQFSATAVKYNSMDDEKLAEQIKFFDEAFELPRSERFSFYKENMQKNEDFLCAKNKSTQPSCQTAQLISALLSKIESKNVYYSKALPVFQILYKVEQAKLFEEKIKILDDEYKKSTPGSNAQLAIKTLTIKIQSQRGEFESAASVLSPEKIKHGDDVVASLLEENFYKYACQAQGFSTSPSGCDTSALEYCQNNEFWKQWSEGCKSPKDQTPKHTVSQLGYLWKNMKSLTPASWKAIKANLTAQSEQEQNIISALDFAITLQSDEPELFVEKSKNIKLSNPLWGWAQSQALAQFGSEWTAMMSAPSQAQVKTYALKISVQEKRAVASVKKKKSKR
jgi:hypothetical protein